MSQAASRIHEVNPFHPLGLKISPRNGQYGVIPYWPRELPSKTTDHGYIICPYASYLARVLRFIIFFNHKSWYSLRSPPLS
jgi:hypothetical protein